MNPLCNIKRRKAKFDGGRTQIYKAIRRFEKEMNCELFKDLSTKYNKIRKNKNVLNVCRRYMVGKWYFNKREQKQINFRHSGRLQKSMESLSSKTLATFIVCDLVTIFGQTNIRKLILVVQWGWCIYWNKQWKQFARCILGLLSKLKD